MQRREVMLGVGAAVLTASGPIQAGAENGLTQRLHAALRVRFADGAFQTFNGFQIQSAGGAWGRDWGGDLRVYPEDRADLGTGGGLLGRPFRARWAEALPIGTVARSGSRLIGTVQGGHFAGRRVTVAAGDTSWDLPRTLQPAQRVAATGPTVGAIRLGDDGHVLVSLNARPAY